MKRSLRTKAFMLVTFNLLLVSCGKQGGKIVKDVVVRTQYVENEVHIALDLEFAMGNINLPAVTLPIYLPKLWTEIGEFSMVPVLGGSTLLRLDLNLSSITEHIRAEQSSLPNGSLLPLIGLTKTIAIPIRDKVVIYVTLGDGVAAIGLAANIRGMDSMGRSIGTSSLFPVFAIKNVYGAAGLYTSANSGQSGIGFFADLSQVLDPVTFIDLGIASEEQVAKSFGAVQLEALPLRSVYPSRRKERKIKRAIYRMHKRNQFLEF